MTLRTKSVSARYSAAEPCPRRHFRPGGEASAFGLLSLVVLVLVVLPLARLVQDAAWRTLDAGFCSMLLSTGLGLAMALLVAASDIRGRAALVFAFMLPLMIPPQITALSWMQLTGASSPLLNALGIAPPLGSPNPLYTREGLILLLGIQHAPLVFITVAAAIRRLPMELLDAARLAGAGTGQALRYVLLPLLWPAIVAGAALAFVSAIGNFGIAAMIGIPAGYTLLPVLIYQRLASFGPTVIAEVAVLAILVGILALLGVLLQRHLRGRRDVSLDLPGGRPLIVPLGACRPVAEAGAWLVVALALVLPLLALLAAALAPAVGVRLSFETITLQHFTEVLLRQDATRRAFANSGLLAAAAAVLLAMLALPLAFFIAWRPSRATALLDALVELPYALPGVVLAVAMIMLFLPPLPLLGVSLYGTLAIILIAYLSAFMTLALRPALAGMAQLDPAVDEAAQLDGAGLAARLRYILLPLLAPLAVAGGLLVFMTAFNELTISALLWSVGTETLGVIVFNLADSGYQGLAAAVASLTVLVILILMVLVERFDRRHRLGIVPWASDRPGEA